MSNCDKMMSLGSVERKLLLAPGFEPMLVTDLDGSTCLPCCVFLFRLDEFVSIIIAAHYLCIKTA